MNSNGIIEVLFGRPHANGNGETLQHLICTRAKDMAADDLLPGTDSHQLHCRVHAALGKCVLHRGETGLVDLYRITMQFTRIGLTQTDSTDGRVCD